MKKKDRRNLTSLRKIRQLKIEAAKERRISSCNLWNNIFFWSI